MIGPVWRRDAVIDFNGSVIRSEEMFFVHRTDRFEPSAAGRTGLERAYIHGHRWCDATMISELVARGETVYPLQFGELLDEANALADARGGARGGSCNRSADMRIHSYLRPPLDWISSDSEEIAVDTAPENGSNG